MESKVLLRKKAFVQSFKAKCKKYDKFQWKVTLALCSCVFCISCATSSRVEQVEDVTKRSEENVLALSYQVANLEAKIDAVHTEVGHMEGRTYEVLNKSGKKTGWTARAMVPVEHVSPLSGTSSGATPQTTAPKPTAKNRPTTGATSAPQGNAQTAAAGNSSPTLLLPPQEAPSSTSVTTGAAPTNVAGGTQAPKPSAPAVPVTTTPVVTAPVQDMQSGAALQASPTAAIPVVALPPTTSETSNVSIPSAVDPSIGSTPVVAHSKKLPAPTAAEQTLYKTGLDLVLSGSADAGRTKLTEFLNLYPASRLTANAYYWIGESLYSQAKFADALMAFKQGSLRFPTHDKTADSLLKAGMTYDKLGDSANARLQYESVVLNFPNSNAAKIARSKIRR